MRYYLEGDSEFVTLEGRRIAVQYGVFCSKGPAYEEHGGQIIRDFEVDFLHVFDPESGELIKDLSIIQEAEETVLYELDC